jgi:hypothetical protein
LPSSRLQYPLASVRHADPAVEGGSVTACGGPARRHRCGGTKDITDEEEVERIPGRPLSSIAAA